MTTAHSTPNGFPATALMSEPSLLVLVRKLLVLVVLACFALWAMEASQPQAPVSGMPGDSVINAFSDDAMGF